jgi:hypothetical protein
MVLIPLVEVLPIVRPKAADEIIQQWIAQYYEPRQADERRVMG